MDTEAVLLRLRNLVDYINQKGRLSEVEGFLDDFHGYALLLLARDGPGIGAIVEIGSFMGKSTCWLAIGSLEGNREKVVAIDHFEGSEEHQADGTAQSEAIVSTGTSYPQFLENIKKVGVADHVVPFKGSSQEAAKDWEGPIRLLFIDGDHSYEGCKRDFWLWAPFVVPGGIIAIHDVGYFDGSTQFYKELMSETEEYTELFTLTHLAIIRKG